MLLRGRLVHVGEGNALTMEEVLVMGELEERPSLQELGEQSVDGNSTSSKHKGRPESSTSCN